MNLRTRRTELCALLMGFLLCLSAPSSKADEINKNQNWTGRTYRSVTRSNIRFMLEEDLARNSPDVAEKAMNRLSENLEKIFRVTPAHCHSDFTRLTFYLMDGSAATEGGRDSGLTYYRPNAPSFRHNLDPAWNDVVVVYSAKNYTKITDLWAMKSLMHELAHAYHLHHWNQDEPEILAAWQHAESAGLYRNVNDVNGKVVQEAYALRNQLEYFADLSAAYFVGNNYYPTDRATLAKYDPTGYEMIKKFWRL